MGVILEINEGVSVPPEGTKELILDENGDPVLLAHDATTAPLGGGGTADGVSIDGVGTVGDPFAIIPSYITGLVGGADWTRVDVVGNEQNEDIDFSGDDIETIEIVGYVPNNNAAASTLSLQPIEVTTPITANQTSQELGASGDLTCNSGGNTGTGTMSSFVWSLLAAGYAGASGSTMFHLIMTTASGAPRFFSGEYVTRNSSNAITNKSTIQGVWQDLVTVMAGVRLHSDRSDGIKAGSVFWYRTSGAAA